MNATKFILIATGLVIISIPFAGGTLSLPSSLHPKEVGTFLASWFNYYFALCESFISSLNVGSTEPLITMIGWRL